ncbi:MAG: bifunctional metallophosphatase/5'-nucleotidase [Clostridiales bacterium]|nr:bifunctional metallophosphatase/5'-nucleotidase [Clostridiales bacterium]
MDINMRKVLSLFIAVVFFLTLFLLPAISSADAKDKELSVAFTHDLHSYIDTKEYDTNGKAAQVGGFAKIKTILDDIRASNDNTVIVDAGDFSMGTLYQTVFTEKAIELRMLGLLGYDVFTLGNHEFDYGSGGLAKMLDSALESGDPLPQMVISNIDWDNSLSNNAQMLKKSMTNYGVKDYVIIQKNDVKVAVFGGMGIDAEECAPNSELVFINYIDRAKEIAKAIEEVENPDIIIYLSHGGTWEDPKKSEDEILAKEVPEIDLIVSGHTHSTIEEPLIIGNTSVVSSGEYGEKIGKIDLIQDEDGTWNIKDYKLIVVDEHVETDEEMVQKIHEYGGYVNEFLNAFGFEDYQQEIAYSPYEFANIRDMEKNHIDQPLSNLITDSLIYGVKQAEGDNYIPIDVSIVPVGIIRSSFKQGPITISDVYEVMSLGIGDDGITGYPLASVYLTGKELKTVAEVDASITPIMASAQLYTTGLTYTYNPNRVILNRAIDVKLVSEDGNFIEIDDDKLYRVVADIYSAQMLGAVMDKSKGILSIIPKDSEGNKIEDFSQAIVYDNKGNEVKEWYVLASYLQSFEKEDDLPTIPSIYENAQNRKVLYESMNIGSLVKEPNKIFFIVMALIILLILMIGIVIKFVVKKIKTRFR